MTRRGWGQKVLPGIIICIFAAASLGASETTVRRFGLFVGANNGGEERVVLRYAATDAEAVAAVMQRAGGLQAEDTILLKDPSRQELLDGIRDIDAYIARTKTIAARQEFVFYYSGHSDEEGLMLGRERLGYKELKDELKAVGADVQIAILDSCSSGAFTRLKGGERRSPFLFDESTEAAGHAFLTSSSESEAAQESDEIGGSFFTHYLLIALSGAADTSLDSRVSLNEAYSFASSETLARTEYTVAGPQHPSYEINLTGTGDLVLTDLREGVERIVFTESLSGRISIRDRRGKLVLEMYKERDRPVTITLPPEGYTVTLDDGHSLQRTSIILQSGSSVDIVRDDFQRVYRDPGTVRGDLRGVEDAVGDVAETERYSRETYSGVDANIVCVRSGSMEGIQLGLIGAIVEGEMEGIQVSSVFNIGEGKVEGVQLAGVFNISEGTLEGPQIAGVFNITEGSVEGPQIAGVFNISEGTVVGPQIAGVFNIVEGAESSGLQLAGTFNIAEDFEGSQIGVVNIAEKMTGLQAGVVNISEELNGIPIGLINIAGNGLHHLSAWYDQNEMLNLGFQLGTFYYTFFQAAVDTQDLDQEFSAGIGMGLEVPLGRFFFDTEVYGKTYASGQGSFDNNVAEAFSDNALPFPAVRMSLGRRGWGKGGFFVGLDMALHFQNVTDYVPGVMHGTPWSLDYSGQGDIVDIYPIWFCGIRL